MRQSGPIGLFSPTTRQTPVKTPNFVVDSDPMSAISSPHPSNSSFELDSFVPRELSIKDGSVCTCQAETAANRGLTQTATRPGTDSGLELQAAADLDSQTTPSQIGTSSPGRDPNDDEDRRSNRVLSPNISVEAAQALDHKLREIEQALKDEAQLLATKATRQRALVDDSRDDALVGLEPAPLPATWLIDGDPSPRIKIMTCSPEGGLLSGIWTCRAATFRFDYATFDETVHIIRGIAEVRIGNEITYLRPGSIAYFPKGASSEWTVHEPIHKYFVQRNSNRGVRKMQRLLGRLRRSEHGALG